MFKQLSTQPLFQLRLGRRVFAPSLLPTIAFIVFFVLCLGLAHWQFDRSDYKKSLLAEYAARPHLPALSLSQVETQGSAANYRVLQLSGQYDNAHTFLLDNRMQGGTVGYEVMTPFHAINHVILIDRGWVAANPNRHILPMIPTVSGEQKIDGLVKFQDKKPFMMGSNFTNTDWPRVSQALEFNSISDALQQHVEPFIVLLNPNAAGGFSRVWKPDLRMGPEKHIGYAFQWLALALTLAIIYLLLNLKKT